MKDKDSEKRIEGVVAPREIGATTKAQRDSLVPANLMSRVFSILKSEGISGASFIRDAGLLWSATKLSSYKKDFEANQFRSIGKIPREELLKIQNCLNRIGQATEGQSYVTQVAATDHALQFALMGFFDVRPETDTEVKTILPGLYRLYRPSLKIPNMFTVGMFEISLDKDNGALKTRETRIFKKQLADQDKASGISLEQGITDAFEGYIFRKRRRYISVQRSTSVNRGKGSSASATNFLVTVFSDEFFSSETRQIASLSGVAFGSVGSKVYTARVFIERCDARVTREELIKEIDYKNRNEIPPSVARTLRMPKKLEDDDDYIIF